MEAFLSALSNINPAYILALLAGTTVGYIIGAIPGFNSTMGVALFVPFSYTMTADVAFAFLLSLYCSSIFAGSIPAILINTPGTPSSVATVWDGHPMSNRGQAGRAMGLSMMSSVVGGILSAVILMASAQSLARLALKFGPQEYFALAVLGISMIVGMVEGNVVRGLLSAFIGLSCAVIGMDPLTSYPRYTFGHAQLLSGLDTLPIMIGVFAISEMLVGLDKDGNSDRVLAASELKSIFSGFSSMLKHWWLILKSAVLGTFLGALPGVGTTTAAIMAYNEARRSSKTPERFGTGVDEGIIAPETANNAVSGGALIPMLALGIPGDAVTAVLLGALMIQGLQPGPMLFMKSPQVVASIYVSMMLSNILILLFSLFAIPWMTKILKVSHSTLSAFVIIFCLIGSYASRNSYFDVYVALIAGVVGFVLRKLDIPSSPLVLALVLGEMIEQRLVISLQASKGSWLTFFTRPISGVLMVVSIAFIGFSILRTYRKKRQANAEAVLRA